MEWEARTNERGYTYYYHVSTGAMQWSPPDSSKDDELSIPVSAADVSDSSSDEDESTEVEGANPVEPLIVASDHAPGLVLDTVLWLMREIWQSHVEITQFLTQSSQSVIQGLVPRLQELMARRPALAIHPHPIPASFIPTASVASLKQNTAQVQETSEGVDELV
ncbi:hypothetical protein AC1031_016278 [Aphanomyces cochlioides]|nr:hypothetical protein AC1031_016278 [Aphanomyces cochlioides]